MAIVEHKDISIVRQMDIAVVRQIDISSELYDYLHDVPYGYDYQADNGYTWLVDTKMATDVLEDNILELNATLYDEARALLEQITSSFFLVVPACDDAKVNVNCEREIF